MDTPLLISDAESIYNAILKLVISYPNYPASFTPSQTTVLWNSIPQTNGIGLFPMQGAIYLRRYVSGSYVAQVPFRIVYKTGLTNNSGKINSQVLIENVGKWLETCGIDFKDSNFTLESIQRTSPVYLIDQDEKTTSLAVNLQAKYSFKKG